MSIIFNAAPLVSSRKRAQNLHSKQAHKDLRPKIIKLMGSKCVKCGFADVRALQIDHVNSDGHVDRKNGVHGPMLLYKIRKSVLSGENKYQLLCANCNWIKKHEMKEKAKGIKLT